MDGYIITCHDVYNYGASLQAYALSKYLTLQGHEVEIIDYKAPYLYRLINFFEVDTLKFQRNIFTKIIYCIYMFPRRMRFFRKYYKYKQFNKKSLALTTKKYTNNDELKTLKEKDFYVCGSDQIWNSLNFPCGKDPAFYLQFAPKTKKRISYAASFGANEIGDGMENFVTKEVSALSAISVREESGIQILKKLGVNNSYLVCDPVFLIDVGEWNKTSGKEPIIKEKYVLVYGFDNMELILEIARKYCELYNAKLVSLYYQDVEEDYRMCDSGPVEFLNLIRFAECVITNSFHATAFSLIFQRQFIVVNRTEKGLSERLDNILGLAELKERNVNTVTQAVQAMQTPIVYEGLPEGIEKLVEKSRLFLKESIND